MTYYAKENTTARAESSYASYILGSHEWLFEDDDVSCSVKGVPYRRKLKLSGCSEGQFTCSDGQCIRD